MELGFKIMRFFFFCHIVCIFSVCFFVLLLCSYSVLSAPHTHSGGVQNGDLLCPPQGCFQAASSTPAKLPVAEKAPDLLFTYQLNLGAHGISGIRLQTLPPPAPDPGAWFLLSQRCGRRRTAANVKSRRKTRRQRQRPTRRSR